MPKQTFALGTSTLELEWGWNWKNFTVRVDGKEVGRLADKSALEAGGSWTLDDGSKLEVILAKQFGNVELRVTQDGIPVPGSASDPEAQLKAAAGIAFFIGGLNVLLGVLAALAEIQVLIEIGLGWFSVAFGALFIGLGLAIRKGSELALWAAIIIFAIDGLLSVYLVIDAGGTPPVGSIVFRVFLIIAMAKATGAKKRSQAIYS